MNTSNLLAIGGRLFVSVLLGGVVGTTLQQLGYDDDVAFDPSVVAGQRVLITGASSGIGEQLAYQYARQGARLFITARRQDLLVKVAQECRQLGAPYVGHVVADLTRVVDAARVVHMAQQSMGGIDQVIMGHAYFPAIRQWTGSGRDFSDVQVVYDVNVKSYIHTATHALPYLRASNGSLGIVTSVAAKLYVPYRPLYTMSKHAVDGFFSSLRGELHDAHVNVSVTSCLLGAIDTDRKRGELEEASRRLTPLQLQWTYRQLASPEAAAHVIMKGITTRKREIYYPPTQGIKARILFGELFPSYSEISFAIPNMKR